MASILGRGNVMNAKDEFYSLFTCTFEFGKNLRLRSPVLHPGIVVWKKRGEVLLLGRFGLLGILLNGNYRETCPRLLIGLSLHAWM